MLAPYLLCASGGLVNIHVKVDGIDRRAIVYLPAKRKAAPPVLFVFHGHGGSADNFSSRFKVHAAWPEAITVYPDGLPITYGVFTRQGWDVTASENNRDIKFFDALYSVVLKAYHPNPKAVFALGHSNGGMFIYTLWGMRPTRFTALASTEGWLASKVTLTPKPFFISIGSEDEVVAPQVQLKALREAMRVDRSAAGTPYGEKGTYYPGQQPLVYWAYKGPHLFPRDCLPTLIHFFKRLK